LGRSPRAERALLLGVLLAGFVHPAQARELAFSRRGEPVATRSLDALRAAVPPATVRVHEPYEAHEVAFSALPFDRVLDAIYTPTWRDEEELLFTCSDGYQPTIPVKRVLSHRAWLAFDRVGPGGFTIRKRESGEVRQIELGPFYLVWENLHDAQVRQEADYGWPYQLVGIDLIRSRDHFPRMAPPPGASAQVLDGFAAYRVHCSKCHKLNGEGGSLGPELNSAVSPLKVRDPTWLRTWIEDPSRIRLDARMPPLNPSLPDRGRTVDAILAYLEAMVTAGPGAGGR
jgi:mono/diheme cytochrome c family protein